MSERWGPATLLAIAMEKASTREAAIMKRRFEIYLYGGSRLSHTYVLPVYELRRRAMYGGRKGRAAIKRLKAMGFRPVPSQSGDDE